MSRNLTKSAARKMQAKRKTYGGPPKVFMPCGWCGMP